ncbi:hypothetical protein MGWOODY_Clf199 [hydrothermal vent metagenome]|uniref:Uncharacterized protein n=1 Tax=hydrothermal vent metagenome TaxID=652676 RepID=A0A160VF42_9ZZZZ
MIPFAHIGVKKSSTSLACACDWVSHGTLLRRLTHVGRGRIIPPT